MESLRGGERFDALKTSLGSKKPQHAREEQVAGRENWFSQALKRLNEMKEKKNTHM